jgi:hypothetical protein
MANGHKCIHCGHDESYHFHSIGPVSEEQADEQFDGYEYSLRTCPEFEMSEEAKKYEEEKAEAESHLPPIKSEDLNL